MEEEGKRTMTRTYSELILLPTFRERFEYAKIADGRVGKDTFGFSRYLNQDFYKSPLWRQFRDKVILRDKGCDLAMNGYDVERRAYIHHLNPITKEQLINNDPVVWDLENVVLVSFDTHQAIHYGNYDTINKDPIIRTPNDTCPWRTVAV